MSLGHLQESALPVGWRKDKLFRLCDLMGSGGTPASGNPDFYDGGIPWVQTGDLTDDVLESTSKTLTVEGVANSATRYFPSGTLLMAMYGATIGKLGILKTEATLNQACCALVPRKVISLRFMFFKLLSLRSEFIAAGRGGGQQNISQDTVKQTYIVYPKFVEQQRIAAYLDASCAAIDAAVTAKRRQLDTLDALRKSIIQRAVTQGIASDAALEPTGNVWLEQIPRGWKLVALKRIAEIRGGLTLGKQYEGELIERPYLRVGNVQNGHLDLTDVSVIELPASVAAGVELRPNDVLMTEGGDLDKLGRGHLWRGEIAGCLHQNHIFAVRCFPHKLNPMFLAYATAAQYGRDYFEATGKKTTNLANTNATKVGLFPIPLPPLADQTAICAHLDAKTAEVDRITATITAQIDTLTAYRKSLIHECVTGQRRVTDADIWATK
jgi:type I restriction enzyme S subunit